MLKKLQHRYTLQRRFSAYVKFDHISLKHAGVLLETNTSYETA